MITPKTLSASSEQDIINLVELNKFNDDPTSYWAILRNDYCEVELRMDVDPGSGYQRPNESTFLRAGISIDTDFIFSIRSKTNFDRIMEMLGKTRPKTGYDLFDRKVVIYATNEKKLLQIINNPQLLRMLSSLNDFCFSIKINEAITNKHLTLELTVNHTENDNANFKTIYQAFCTVLNNVENYTSLFQTTNMVV